MKNKIKFSKDRNKISRTAIFSIKMELLEQTITIIGTDQKYHNRSQWTSHTIEHSSTVSRLAGGLKDFEPASLILSPFRSYSSESLTEMRRT